MSTRSAKEGDNGWEAREAREGAGGGEEANECFM